VATGARLVVKVIQMAEAGVTLGSADQIRHQPAS
jgi:hypothetical protein